MEFSESGIFKRINFQMLELFPKIDLRISCSCSHGDNFCLKTLAFHLQATDKEETAPEKRSHESKAKKGIDKKKYQQRRCLISPTCRFIANPLTKSSK